MISWDYGREEMVSSTVMFRIDTAHHTLSEDLKGHRNETPGRFRTGLLQVNFGVNHGASIMHAASAAHFVESLFGEFLFFSQGCHSQMN